MKAQLANHPSLILLLRRLNIKSSLRGKRYYKFLINCDQRREPIDKQNECNSSFLIPLLEDTAMSKSSLLELCLDNNRLLITRSLLLIKCTVFEIAIRKRD